MNVSSLRASGTARRSGRSRSWRAAAALTAAVAALMASPLPVSASPTTVVDDTAWVNGRVFAIAQVGDRTYIGGEFTTVGGRTRNHIAAIKADGTLDNSFDPNVDGTVYSITGTADGKIVLGGLFTQVGSEPRANLAAVDPATGAVAAGWSADTVGSAPEVLALASSGTRVYAGGRFTGIDGTTRKRLVAIDTATGNIIKLFRPGAIAAAVKFLDVNADGSRLYVAGGFDKVGDYVRAAGVAELDTLNNGTPTAFNPEAVGSRITAMGSSPDSSVLYAGVADNRVFAYNVADSSVKWSIKNGGDTQAIAASDTEVYLGGHFGRNITQKVNRQWLESVNAADGTVTAWDARLGGGSMGVWAIEFCANSVGPALCVGGEFTSVDGVNHPRFARFGGGTL